VNITLPDGTTLNLASDSLAKQLRIVAQMIASAPRMGLLRQVFMVSVSGFDAHAFQMRDQPLMMARVAQAIGWFMDAIQGVGMSNNVTLFTASDFGRTLLSNGDGSDHGWGSHHFVAGGAVRGKQFFGDFPVTALGTSSDVGSGRLLPSTGVTQLAGSLAGWMGLNATERQLVRVGRYTIYVAMGIGILIAPQLRVLDQAYQFIQEYSSFITPGVFAIFILGMFWKRTTSAAALTAALLTIPLSTAGKFRYPEIPFLDRMGYIFLILCAVIVAVSLADPKSKDNPKGLKIEASMFQPGKSFVIGSVLICGVLAALYTIFW